MADLPMAESPTPQKPPRPPPEVLVPLVSGDKTGRLQEVAFFPSQLRPVRWRSWSVSQNSDRDFSEQLKPIGYWDAGIVARNAYCSLMERWRRRSPPLLRPLLAAPPAVKLEVNHHNFGYIQSAENRSSQLGLLLGLLAARGQLPFQTIYASGELAIDRDDVRVKAVGQLEKKFQAIIARIRQDKPTGPVLVAVPRLLEDGSPSKAKLGPLWADFRAEPDYQHLQLEILHCDRLEEELAARWPRVRRYRHWRPTLLALPPLLGLLFGLLWAQHRQPLYLNWRAADASGPNQPLFTRANGDGLRVLAPPCGQSQPGEPVYQQGDWLTARVHIDDYSWWRGRLAYKTALVSVGDGGGIRVENIEPVPGRPYFQTAYALAPPSERQLLMVIARRSYGWGDRGIDKGRLALELKEKLQPLQGIDRLSAAAGYLEARYSGALQYRFRTVDRCSESDSEP